MVTGVQVRSGDQRDLLRPGVVLDHLLHPRPDDRVGPRAADEVQGAGRPQLVAAVGVAPAERQSDRADEDAGSGSLLRGDVADLLGVVRLDDPRVVALIRQGGLHLVELDRRVELTVEDVDLGADRLGLLLGRRDVVLEEGVARARHEQRDLQRVPLGLNGHAVAQVDGVGGCGPLGLRLGGVCVRASRQGES
jgi:hypothetical protein